MKEPLLTLGMLEAGAPVVVNFKDLILRGPDPVVVAVVALPPFFAVRWARAEAIVRPGFDYIRDNILLVIEAEGSRNLNLAAYGNLYLSTEKLWNHVSCLLEQYFQKRGSTPLKLPVYYFLG